ncbi:Glycogen phosphorylase 1, partial [Tetrabaena socialis]
MAYRQLQGNRVAGSPAVNAGRQAPLGRVARSRGSLLVSAVAEAEKTAVATTAVPAVTADIAKKLRYQFGRNGDYTVADAYQGTAWSVREKLIDAFNHTHDHWKKEDPKFIYYMSAEFLMGRSLTNTINNLGLKGDYADALTKMGYEMENVVDAERDASLGNGGLGRLAACFLDSMATLDLPGWGYGIRYKYGMFKQGLKDGCQTESPDIWLTKGNPWEIRRDDVHFSVGFGGRVERRKQGGKEVSVWIPSEKVTAQAYDNPISGYDTPTVGNLRLWDAVPVTEFDLSAFNAGDYERANLERERAEGISAVLYPNDSTPEGKELRLKQQYFFVCASLQDVMSRFKATNGTKFELLPEKAVFQMNDTHPTIAVAELMRLLVDVEGMDWAEAWTISTKCLNYTNHTVMPEALEKWPVKVMAKMLPRHMEIIEVINEGWTKWLGGHLKDLKADERAKRVAAMSIIHENPWNKEEMWVPRGWN